MCFFNFNLLYLVLRKRIEKVVDMESEMEEFECQEESEEQKKDSSQEDEKERSKDVSFLQISRGND